MEMFVNGYDASIFHIPEFVREGVKIPAFVIPPSIDLLHEKNKELKEGYIEHVLSK